MMLTGLQTFLKSLPLDGTPGKSQSGDSETIQPISFGEVLKRKEKQLQQTQEVSASSIAAAFAALQTLALGISLPISNVETNETSVETEVSKPPQGGLAQLATNPIETSDSSAAPQALTARFNATESADPTSQPVSNTEDENSASHVLSQTELSETQSTQKTPVPAPSFAAATSTTPEIVDSFTDLNANVTATVPATKRETSSANDKKSDFVATPVSITSENKAAQSAVDNRIPITTKIEVPQPVINAEILLKPEHKSGIKATAQPAPQTNKSAVNYVEPGIKASNVASPSNTTVTETNEESEHKTDNTTVLNSDKREILSAHNSSIEIESNQEINDNANTESVANKSTFSSNDPESIQTQVEQGTPIFETTTLDVNTTEAISFKPTPFEVSETPDQSTHISTYHSSAPQVTAKIVKNGPSDSPVPATTKPSSFAQTIGETENVVARPRVKKQTLNTSQSLPETTVVSPEPSKAEIPVSEPASAIPQQSMKVATANVRTTTTVPENEPSKPITDFNEQADFETLTDPSITEKTFTVESHQPQDHTTKIQNEQSLIAEPSVENQEFDETTQSELPPVSEKLSFAPSETDHAVTGTQTQTGSEFVDQMSPSFLSSELNARITPKAEASETGTQAFISHNKTLEKISEPEVHNEFVIISARQIEQPEAEVLSTADADPTFEMHVATKVTGSEPQPGILVPPEQYISISHELENVADIRATFDAMASTTIREPQTNTNPSTPMDNEEVQQSKTTTDPASYEIYEDDSAETTIKIPFDFLNQASTKVSAPIDGEIVESSFTRYEIPAKDVVKVAEYGSQLSLRQNAQTTAIDANDDLKAEVSQAISESPTLNGNSTGDHVTAQDVYAKIASDIPNEPAENTTNLSSEETTNTFETELTIEHTENETLRGADSSHQTELNRNIANTLAEPDDWVPSLDTSAVNESNQSEADSPTPKSKPEFAAEQSVAPNIVDSESLSSNATQSINTVSKNSFEQVVLEVGEAVPQMVSAVQPSVIAASYDETAKVQEDILSTLQAASQSQEIETPKVSNDPKVIFSNFEQPRTETAEVKKESQQPASIETPSGFVTTKATTSTEASIEAELEINTLAKEVEVLETNSQIPTINIDSPLTANIDIESEYIKAPSAVQVEVSKTANNAAVISGHQVAEISVPEIATQPSDSTVSTIKMDISETVSCTQQNKNAVTSQIAETQPEQASPQTETTIDNKKLPVSAEETEVRSDIADVPQSDGESSAEKATSDFGTVKKQKIENIKQPEIVAPTANESNAQSTESVTAQTVEWESNNLVYATITPSSRSILEPVESPESAVDTSTETNLVEPQLQQELPKRETTKNSPQTQAVELNEAKTPQLEQVTTPSEAATNDRKIASDFDKVETHSKRSATTSSEPEVSAENVDLPRTEKVASKVPAVEHKKDEGQIQVDAAVNVSEQVATEPVDSQKIAVEVKPMESEVPSVEPKGKPNIPNASSVKKVNDIVGETSMPVVSGNDLGIPVSSKPNIAQGPREESKARQSSKDEEVSPVEKQPKLNQTPEAAMPVNGPEREAVELNRNVPSPQVNTHATEVVQQVIRHIDSNLKSGPASMNLQLNPKELGTIDIQMVSNSQGVHVTFVAEQASTSKLLETELPQLRESLTNSGVQLSGLDISQHHQSGQKGETFEQNTNFARTSQRDLPQGDTKSQETPSAERRYGQASEVDYLI